MPPETPLRHLVVLAHPGPDSFNHAVAAAWCEAVDAAGQVAELRDLYALGFDPVLRPGAAPDAALAEEKALLQSSDAVVLVYPLWFGMPPAMIKGYIDRVLGAGFTADAIADGLVPATLAGKHLALVSSSGATRPWLDAQGQWVSLRHAFDTYLRTIFGMEDAGHLHLDAVVEGMQARFAEEHLARVRDHARILCAELLRARHAGRMRRILDAAHQHDGA